MKKLLLLLILPLFFACSSKDEVEPNNTETSIAFRILYDDPLDNCVVGYFNEEGLCLELAKIGRLEKNKTSDKIVVTDESIKEVFLFHSTPFGARMLTSVGTLAIKPNEYRLFEIKTTASTSVDKSNPKEYPH